MADVDHEIGAIRFIVLRMVSLQLMRVLRGQVSAIRLAKLCITCNFFKTASTAINNVDSDNDAKKDAPLSSKVAIFNQNANRHQESQMLNPFSAVDGRCSPRQFSKEEYGKPKAGSLTELRGKKANIEVYREMLELCQVIDTEGYMKSKEEPESRMIPFGELFNIYQHVNDKVVGLLLRARKHNLLTFEGEILFQRRDDDVPIYLTKPIKEIRRILTEKQDEIKRSISPNPATCT